MTLYKIRHKPSGLFFKPSRYGSKSNLSKNGKVYHRRPSLQHIGDIYHHPAELPKYPYYYETRRFVASEWEVVELNVEEAA